MIILNCIITFVRNITLKLIIGNQNYSSWSLRPWILLKHFNISFQQYRIKLFTDEMLSDMAAFCPNNKVPVLIDNNIKIWDSLAICEYINEQYLSNKAWPEKLEQRALARSICAEMHSSFFALRNEMPMNCRRLPSPINFSANCQNDIDRVLIIWEECLQKSKGEFLFDTFSIADAFYLPVISRFSSYRVEVPDEVSRYMKHMLSLPCYQDWLKASKQEIEVISYSEV